MRTTNINGRNIARLSPVIRFGRWGLAGWLAAMMMSAASGQTNCPRAFLKFSEIQYQPLAGQPQWIELINTGPESLDARGMEVLSGTNAYSLPLDLAEVPTNGIILIYFDGGGTNDTSFAGDNVAVLHASPTNALGNPAGFAALFQVTGSRSKDTIVDFVAWGADPGEGAALAVEKRLWPARGVFLPTDASDPADGPSFVPMPDGGALALVGGGFQVVGNGDASPGAPNAPGLSAPVLEWPNDGLVTLDPPEKYWWKRVVGAGGYEIQVSSDSAFKSVALAGSTTNLDFKPLTMLSTDAEYWWRVRATKDASASPWSTPWTFKIGFPNEGAGRPGAKEGSAAGGAVAPSNSIAIVPLGARKDTALLAITPGATSRVMCDSNNAANQGWDAPHNQANIQANDLESWWCWGVGIAMVNRYYGGTLRRDEIIYKVRGDLLHDQDAGSSWPQYTPGLFWALNQGAGTNFTIVAPGSARPTPATVTNWIDTGRPIYFRRPGHIMVVRGYRYVGTNFLCEFVNTDNDGSTAWWVWNTVNFGGCAVPNIGLAGRLMDPSVTADGDGDGVMNFDENVRTNSANQLVFGSNPAKADSDDDTIPDKPEIFSWVFPRDGVGGNINGKTFAVKNVDGDGKDPQVDEDSDNGGIKDGEEDKNKNGISGTWDTGNPNETDVFDKRDDAALDLVFCIDLTGSMFDDIAQVKVNAVNIINRITNDFKSYRIAVVAYKDHPISPYGDPGDYPFRDFAAFTTNTATVISAINALSTGGGNDWPESVYSGLMHSLDGGSLGGWRPDPVKRAIIVMGDAPPHDPEPVTGYTLGGVIARAISGGVGIGLGRPTPGKEAGAAGDLGLSGPISIFSLLIGFDSEARSYFEDISEGTGGSLVSASSAGGVPAQIVNLLEQIKLSTLAVLEVRGPGGESDVRGITNIVADASRSIDPEGCGIIKYEWDWDGNGSFDETTVESIAGHDYPGGFVGPITVKITTVGGETNTATFALGELPSGATILSQELNPLIDRQTGLFYQTVIITNNGAESINGLRITATGLPGGAYLVSATGTNGTDQPYVEFAGPLEGGAAMTLTLGYYSTTRVAPTSVNVTVELAEPGSPTPRTGNSAEIRRAFQRADGKWAIEFLSQHGRDYVIEYSNDLTTWKQVHPPVRGTGGTMIWVDAGPPVTDPPSASGRSYRLLLLPQ